MLSRHRQTDIFAKVEHMTKVIAIVC